MTFKKNIKKDLLVVIAYGTSVARYHAARLLFNYWPLYNANKFDRNKPKSIGNHLFVNLSFRKIYGTNSTTDMCPNKLRILAL